MLATRKRRSISDFATIKHETQFIPARRGHGDPINKYPEFIKKKTSELIPEEKMQKTINP